MTSRKIGVTFFKNIQSTLADGLNWNKARLHCMTSLVQGILYTRNVNLARIAASDKIDDGSEAAESSKYRRFQRFFSNFEMPLEDLSRLIRCKIPKPSEGYTLSMDRTNWKFGKKHINVLTVGINVGSVCIPLAWKVLPQSTKNGNSNTKHRQWLIKSVLQVLPAQEIRVLLMDREFCGDEWLKWLDDHDIGFVLRIRKNTIVGERAAHEYKSKPVDRLEVWGMALHFGGKVEKGKRIYVVSNRFKGKGALEIYRRRWGIEQLFSHLKKRGFNLEDTHLTDKKKLERMMGLVSVSFLLSYGWGLHLRTYEKQTAYYRRKSHYNYGLGRLTTMVTAPQKHESLIDEFFRWLKSNTLVQAC